MKGGRRGNLLWSAKIAIFRRSVHPTTNSHWALLRYIVKSTSRRRAGRYWGDLLSLRRDLFLFPKCNPCDYRDNIFIYTHIYIYGHIIDIFIDLWNTMQQALTKEWRIRVNSIQELSASRRNPSSLRARSMSFRNFLFGSGSEEDAGPEDEAADGSGWSNLKEVQS